MLADQQLTAGSKVLYNSVHYKLNMNQQINLQNRFLHIPAFEKILTAKLKSALLKRMKQRKKTERKGATIFMTAIIYGQHRLIHVNLHKESRSL